jgi:hypothetical protein
MARERLAPRREQEKVGVRLDQLKQVKPKDISVRFVFGVVVAVVAGVVGVIFGPKAGGLFLAFPAILPASLTLIEQKENRDKAAADAEGAIAGGFGLAVFALVVLLTIKSLGPAIGLPLALIAWAAVSLGIFVGARALGLMR